MALTRKHLIANPPSLRGLIDLSINRDNIDDSQLKIIVKTGDRLDSGTDAGIWIKLGDSKEKWSKEIKLAKLLKHTEQRGCTDEFTVLKSAISDLQGSNLDITKIELWRNSLGLNDSWYVDVISIENVISGEWFHFPIARWIKANYHYKFQLYDSILPQLAEYKSQRAEELVEKKKVYQYEEKKPGAPVQVKTLPQDETFGVDYNIDLTIDTIRYAIIDSKLIGAQTADRWKSVQDVDQVYQLSMPMPHSRLTWNTDAWFGQQRLQGCNPVLIRLLTAPHPKLPLDQAIVSGILGRSLDEAITQKRIFFVDHVLLEGLTIPEPKERQVPAPIALFYLDEDRQNLLPLAIQLMQSPGPSNPIFYPTDEPNAWLLAKMWFNNADSNYHQSCTHLGFTHLMMESASVAVNRNFSRSHPVFKLMAPHFLYLEAINAKALQKLVAPEGWVDKTLVIGASGMFELIGKASKNWRLDINAVPPADVKARGVDDPTILPHYPYRDDAVRIYAAIEKYVRTIVSYHYDTPLKIQEDFELQSFGEELVKEKSQGGVGYLGVPMTGGKFKTVDEIVTTLAALISTCSMTHAAVNFNQYDEYGFPPNFPTRMSDRMPTTKTGATEQSIAKAIPNKKVTLDIMSITRLLSSKGTNSLGDFEVQYSYDPISLSALRQLKYDLEGISIAIAERNSSPTVHLPYPWLDPEIIPNAISI